MPRSVFSLQVARESKLARLAQLGYADYREYVRSPHWTEVRRAYFRSGRPQVCVCGASEVHLHHKTYERLGAEELDDLVPLCPGCHQMVHALEARGELVNYAELANLDRANRYVDEQHRPARRRAREQAPPDRAEVVMAWARERSRRRRKRA